MKVKVVNMMDLTRSSKLNQHQISFAHSIIKVTQQVLDELEPLCLRIGIDLTVDEAIQQVKAEFSNKMDGVKFKEEK